MLTDQVEFRGRMVASDYPERHAEAQSVTEYDDFADEVSRNRIRYGDSEDRCPDGVEAGRRCPDCDVDVGEFHLPGCHVEVCPKCSGQAIGCNCTTSCDDDAGEDEADDCEDPSYNQSPFQKLKGALRRVWWRITRPYRRWRHMRSPAPDVDNVVYARDFGSDKDDGTYYKPVRTFRSAMGAIPMVIPPGQNYTIDITGLGEEVISPDRSVGRGADEVITADTITDAQIRELREHSLTRHFQNHHGEHRIAMLCNIALTEKASIQRIEARARVAAILNARAKEGKWP